MKKLVVLICMVQSFASSAQLISEDAVPVRVKSFNASQVGTFNQLRWSVTCTVNYANFLIERSTDGVEYKAIHNFKADNVRCRYPFDFEDKLAEGKVFYRLKAGDLDGNFSTSKVVAVLGFSKSFDITALSPAVVQSAAEVSISSAAIDKARIYITSSSGVTVLTKSISLIKGGNTVPLNLSFLKSGVFVLSCESSQGFKTLRFLKI